MTWGQRKRFADGKVNLPYKNFLGYRKGADGFPEVVPEEAVIVRRIYSRFMEGLTSGAIAKELIEMEFQPHLENCGGSPAQWRAS